MSIVVLKNNPEAVTQILLQIMPNFITSINYMDQNTVGYFVKYILLVMEKQVKLQPLTTKNPVQSLS